ncbi:hypothetical protein GIB67_016370 [Kingdonia uniflora]|uniref:Pentatricopeptide repeat-containing protein n=1 Tax=Kingdonia uniflora TaxID=39325 RepID=A0A7J7M443_9MAGN|nr:hypothetical protein GIB67_016370 [Kingdonia uniflora]
MNTMVSRLCRCGLTMEEMGLFRNMSIIDIGSWNSLISGLARNSEGVGALVLFREMQVEGMKGNFLLYMVSVLLVCTVLVIGKQFHGMVIKHGFGMYRPIGNATLDMYENVDAWMRLLYVLETLYRKCNFLDISELAKSIGKRLLELEPREAGAYMILCNFYGRDLEVVAQVRRSMMDRGI